MLLKIFLYLSLFREYLVDCSICGQLPTIDTAFSFKDYTILFSDNKVWFFQTLNKSVTTEPFALNNVIEDNRVKSVDTIFSSINYTNSFHVVYVFSNNKYYLMKPIVSGYKSESEAPVVFIPLKPSTDRQFVPMKWSVFGGKSLDDIQVSGNVWFPHDIYATVVLNSDETYLFHSDSIRYTRISETWPEGNTEFPFSDPLIGLKKIAVFRDITDQTNDRFVIIERLSYCSVGKTQTNIMADIKASCKWKDIKELFGCNNPIDSSTANNSSEIFEPLSTKYHNLIVCFAIIGVLLLISLLMILIIMLFLYKKRSSIYSMKEHGSRTNRDSDVSNTTDLISVDRMSSIQTLDSNSGRRLQK